MDGKYYIALKDSNKTGGLPVVIQEKIPTRAEVPEQYKWRLEDIYASDAEWERDFQKLRIMVKEIQAFKGRLGESPGVLLETLRAEERLQQLNEKIYAYARMRRDEDNTNSIYQAMTDRADSLSTEAQTAVSFILPEILALPEETLAGFRRAERGLDLYEFAFEEIMRQKDHTLSPAEERIIAQAGEVTEAPSNIFKMVNNADITFEPIEDEKGARVEVTHGRYTRLMESRDRRVRRDAFTSMYSSYHKLRNTLAATLSSSVRRDIFYARVRRHPSALQASLFEDNIQPQVYDNLIETVRRNNGAMQRYVDLRRRRLGLDQLHMYDLYVSLAGEVDWDISYAESVEIIKQALAPLGSFYGEIMARGLAAGWVDIYENKGKSSGAYSWGPYGTHPYILMNYQNNLSNLFTLAHELGHAMHSYFAFNAQPYIYAHYKIFTAEVASTVNECLLMDYLLKTVTDRDKKLYLLNHYLEQFRGTVFRQTMFAEFEKIIHARVEAGEALTPDLLGEIYHQLNLDYYGPGIVVDRDIDMEWARIPHFYEAFYVYKYATGFSAAVALSRQILTEGEPAVARYLDFLRSGGSGYPLDLLKAAGVDLSAPLPVQEGLDLFTILLDQVEAFM
ncbi:oligoendopeptidase F [Pelotomaculum sp. FP]|uniref:oligoendopeptidase F n=1 Tax=Pelotomaculum TaxID=191373 RepID=UPI00195F55DC|nr:oligoendopeptidase F [Pelotomaculum sp. FP]